MPIISHRPTRAFSVFAVVFLVALIVVAQLAVGVTRSHAAVDGLMVSYGGWTVGTRQLDSGEFVYCIEPGAITPSGPQAGAQVVSELRGYSFYTYDDTGWAGTTVAQPISGAPLQHINWLLAQYGDTSDAREAVAVQFAIWWLRDSPGEAAWLTHHAAWVEAHGGGAEIARAHELVAEAQREAGRQPSGDPGQLQIHQGNEWGSGAVEYPAGTTSLEISGAVFDNGAHQINIPGDGAGTISWHAEPHSDGWSGEHTVRVTGTWDSQVQTWPAQVVIYPSIDPNQQVLAWAVGPHAEPRSGTFTEESVVIDATFEPVFSTQVVQAEILSVDDVFTDSITLTVDEGQAPWPSRTDAEGREIYVPVRLTGVLYGPFADAQPISEQAPEGAPIAGEVELVADAGPARYEVTADTPPTADGFYYWVWSVEETGQLDEVRAAGLLPQGYRFTDDFGLPSEQHHVRIPKPQPEEPGETAPVSPELAHTGADLEAVHIASIAAPVMLLMGAAVLLTGGLRRHLRRRTRGDADHQVEV